MKKDIIPKDTRYVPLTQQPYCCVPTSIQMVMLRRGLPLVPAELMAHYFGTVVSPDKKKLFWNLPSKKKRPKTGWGTYIREDKVTNKMFKKLKIPLKADFHLIDKFNSATELLKFLHKAYVGDRDILLCLDYGQIWKTDRDSGHVCVLDTVSLKKKEVRIVEPVAEAPKWRIVKVSKLFKSMQYHTKDNMAGCWELVRVK